MTFTPEQTDALKAPLSRDSIKTRDQAGRKLSYIEGWKAISEANRIFGFDGWNRETILLQETNRDLVNLSSSRGDYQQWRIGYIAKVRITVGSIVREGTGYGSGMGRPEALGDAVEGAIKEAETDAMKRAFMTFGNPFGLALYDKDQEEVEKPAARASSAPLQPKPAPSAAPQQSQPETPPADTPAPTISPSDWLKKAIARVKGLDRAGMDEFSEKHHLRIAKCRTVEPVLYEALMEAIRKRHEALG